jgi:RNA polymerase sigma-70 factor (ECF subfamily)
MSSDLELYTRWRHGHAPSGELLFERYFEIVFHFFRARVDQAAEDLTQQTFLACTQAQPGYRGEGSFRAYILTAARSRLYDHIRKTQRWGTHVDIDEYSIEDLATSPSQAVARDQDRRLLELAMRRLPLALNLAVEMYYTQGLRGPELSGALAIPEGTVRSRLRRALTKLRAEMELLGAGELDLEESG